MKNKKKFFVIRSVSELFSSGSYEPGTILFLICLVSNKNFVLLNQELSFVKYLKNLIT